MLRAKRIHGFFAAIVLFFGPPDHFESLLVGLILLMALLAQAAAGFYREYISEGIKPGQKLLKKAEKQWKQSRATTSAGGYHAPSTD